MNRLHPLLSVIQCGGLLLVAKFRRVCLLNSLSRKDRSGDVRALENKYVRCSLKLPLRCCSLLKIKSNILSTIQMQCSRMNGVHQWAFPGPTIDGWLVHTRMSPEVSLGHSCMLGIHWCGSECLAQSEVLSCLDQVFICSSQLSLTLWAVSLSQLLRSSTMVLLPPPCFTAVMVLGRWKVVPGFLQTWYIDLSPNLSLFVEFFFAPCR